MANINILLQRYKNVLVFLAIISVFFLGLSRLHSFFNRKIIAHSRSISETLQKIEVAQKIRFREREISQLRKKFIEDDSFAFINLVGGHIKRVGLATISLRPLSTLSQGFGSGPEGVVKPIGLKLVAVGSFFHLLEFLEIVDGADQNIMVSSMKMQSAPKGIKAEIEIVGLTLKE